MEWVILIFAILTEVAGTTAMKLSRGFTRIVPSIAMGAFYIISFVLLTLALKKINVSVAYAIWSGIGTALIAMIGFLWFKESMNALKIVSLVLIILGVMGLELGNKIH
jgi:small multidrug resistance pump